MRKLGLDIGDKRIGVAISDPSGRTAQSLSTILRKDLAQDLMTIKKIVQKYQVDEIVVGLPVNMDGSLGPQARKVAKVVKIMEQYLFVPVKVWDERLTTLMARRTLISAEVRREKRKKVIDRLAAVLILQGYLDRDKVIGGR